MAETDAIDALVHGKQVAISFRHLSTLLKIPTRNAQTILHKYAIANPALTVLWCVTERNSKTGFSRTFLTTSPRPDVQKQVWAVGPSSAVNASSPQAVWLASDVARDHKLVIQPSHIRNELRDGRWNRIRPATSSWDEQLDPRLRGDQQLAGGPSAVSTPKANSSSLLASVKARAKGKKAKAAGFMTAFKSSTGQPKSLFASKPLGAEAIKKMQDKAGKDNEEKEEHSTESGTPTKLGEGEKEQQPNKRAAGKRQKGKTSKRRQPVKKSRRVIDDESDKENPDPMDDDDDEEDEEQKRMRELEQEAAEKEQADSERAELEKEMMDLNRNDADEEPESPEIKELENVNSPKQEPAPEMEESGSPGGRKRSFWQTFDGGPSGTKRVRKEVKETFEENGYIVTRRVVKIFDENGNEVKDADPGKPEAKQNVAVRDELRDDHSVGQAHPKKAHVRPETPKLTGRLKKDKKADTKKQSTKGGSATKKTSKKKKGNIMSYFGKKA